MEIKIERSRLKISIVVHDLKGGGAEKMMVRLANGLSDIGDDVELVLLTSGGVNKHNVSEKVKLVELKSSRTLSSIPKLMRYLKERRPDRILSALTHVNVISTIACKLTGNLTRLSVSERNAFSKDKHVNPDKLVKFAYFVAPFLYRWQPNPVICVSRGVAEDLASTTTVRSKDTVTAPNPVLDNDFEKMILGTSKNDWVRNKDKPVIIAAGRLSNQKGFDVLIRAFSQVRKSVDALLVIYGEGELRKYLEEIVNDLSLKDYVMLPGYTDQILAEMANSDLFVLSSRFEGSPNVLVEAMSTGIKVIATDCPCGPDEILDSGRIAPLVPVENETALAKAIVLELTMSIDKKSERLKGAKRYTICNSASSYRKILLNCRV